MLMKRLLVTYACLGLVVAPAMGLLSSGCASAGDRDIEGVIATHGLTVAQTIASLQNATIELQKAGTLPTAQALRAQQVYKDIAQHGQQLAQVLRVIDSTRGSGSAPDVSQARDLINKITDGVIAVSALIADGPAAAQIRTLITSLLATTNTILFELGKDQS
jgi:hypothetical protein